LKNKIQILSHNAAAGFSFFCLDTKETKNQVGTNAFLVSMKRPSIVGLFIDTKTRSGQTILQHDIVCFFIVFSSFVMISKGPLLYAGASDN
jgi:hypothetical protein